ncbi:MAG: hypothetical protein AAF936_08605 [Pseudomonadota bacterium]
MIDPVMSRPAGTLVADVQQSVDGLDYGPGVVSEQDKALFQERLNAPAAEDLAVDVGAPVQQQASWVLPAPPTPPGVLSVGERILQGMNGFQDSWSGAVDSMQMLASRNDLKPAEMLNIQFQIGFSSMMLSTISQEVGSVSQKIDGILKTG